MANDFDQFPIYDPLIKSGSTKISDAWSASMSSFYQNIVGYLSQYGMFMPQLTTAQRDEITTPQNGQLIYNTTLGSAQYYKAGTWTSI